MARTERMKQSQLGKWYNIHFENVPTGTSETATINLENDLGIEEDEAILIWGHYLSFGLQVESEAFTVDRHNALQLRTYPYNGAPPNEFILPLLTIWAIKDGVNHLINGDMFVREVSQPPVLVFANFAMTFNNFDVTNAHDGMAGFLYSVVKIDEVTALDIFELARRSTGETT